MKHLEHRRKCRIAQAEKLPHNLYERMRCHIVRVVQEQGGHISGAAKELGCSESTVRRYLKFISFEKLLRAPELEERFDWRSMTRNRWEKLLKNHPAFISRLPGKNNLTAINELEIILCQPQLAVHFDLQKWNDLELEFCWSRLLQIHPEFASQCNFAMITALAAKDLLSKQPQFFDRIRIETLWPYHWQELLERQPQIGEKMEMLPSGDWPFNFKVCYLRNHPEFEPEFNEWDKIAEEDWLDIRRDQPGVWERHHNQN